MFAHRYLKLFFQAEANLLSQNSSKP